MRNWKTRRCVIYNIFDQCAHSVELWQHVALYIRRWTYERLTMWQISSFKSLRKVHVLHRIMALLWISIWDEHTRDYGTTGLSSQSRWYSSNIYSSFGTSAQDWTCLKDVCTQLKSASTIMFKETCTTFWKFLGHVLCHRKDQYDFFLSFHQQNFLFWTEAGSHK